MKEVGGGPKKKLGQNFLTSGKIAGDIVSSAGLISSDVVLEIGPGKGFLTKEILKTGAKIIAIEKDKALVSILNSLFASEIKKGSLEIISGDIREFLNNKTRAPNRILLTTRYKLIANIPYYLTSYLITSFLRLSNPPTEMILMVQKEVAERIIAKDGKENLLSLSVKYYGEPKIERLVKAGSFFPKPKVDSAVLSIKNIRKENSRRSKTFFNLIEKSFNQKRKKMFSVLSQSIKKETLAKAFEKGGFSQNIRAEDLSLGQWRLLADFIPIE